MANHLKAWRESVGLKQEAVGERLGITKGTISKVEKRARIGSDWLEKLAPLYGTTPDKLLAPPPLADDERAAVQLAPVLSTARLPIRYRVGAGNWVEVDNQADQPFGWETVPPRPDIPAHDQWLEQVVGDSFDMRYPEGTILHVRAGWAIDWFKMHGRRVIVQRSREEGRYLERTVKEIVVTSGDKIELWPRSYNPKWSKPIRWRAGLREGDEVEIVGLVIRAILIEAP